MVIKMRIRVADYIADFLAGHGIEHVFTVVGGGAMHLNDAFGHHDRIKCIYNHHEQACAIAAEGYYRTSRKMPAVCVTSGPGATNTITGVAGAWVDSIPMLVISGQSKRELTVRYSGLKLRTVGNQEVDIVRMVEGITKYSEMITAANDIQYALEKALYVAKEGRPGPCLLDIPLDIQGAVIETEDLHSFEPEKEGYREYKAEEKEIAFILEKLAQAKRPVIYAGSAIRNSGNQAKFRALVEKMKIPVVTCWNSIDVIETTSGYYAGRGGIMGNRAGNFAVQNSDLVLSLGSRLNILQVGYDIKTWAREAYCIMVDIDPEELRKPTIRVDKGICADVGDVIDKLLEYYNNNHAVEKESWVRACNEWKLNYPVVMDKHYQAGQTGVNVYAFMDTLSRKLPEGSITVAANGSASVVGSQAYHIRENQLFIINCGLSSMGYDLPAAIGACVANGSREVICIAGEGSLQMNLQELQTIITNKLPIKLFVINNGGYHQIRQTQKNLFGDDLVGVGEESGDLDFPECEALALLYHFKFFRCTDNKELDITINNALKEEGPVLCEVVVTKEQGFEPKSSTMRKEDGTLVSAPLEDMAPFLDRDELKKNMFIACLDE